MDQLTSTSPLTKDEKDRFFALVQFIQDGHEPALIRSAVDGRPCAIVSITEVWDEEVFMMPVAMILLDEDFERLTDPTADLEEVKP